MKNAIRLVTLSVAALVMGCIPLSLHPLYTEETQAFDANLVGSWVALDGDSETTDGWFFVSDDQSTYRLVIREDGKADPMQARLLRIGESLFLDLFPAEVDLGDASQPGLKLGDYYKFQLVRMHSFLRVDTIGEELHLRSAHFNTLSGLVKDNPESIAHEVMPDDSDWFFFTAAPEDLQQWVAEHETALFEHEKVDPIVLKRRPVKATNQE